MRVARFLAIVVLLLAILLAALYLLRKPVASWALRQGMAQAGLENPQGEVTALTLDAIRIENLSAGPAGGEGIRFAQINSDYHWRQVLSERSVKNVRVGPGLVRVNIDQQGRISFPGINLGEGGGDSAGALPFETLTLSDVEISIDAPEGQAAGSISAEYDQRTGGVAELEILSNMLRFGDMTISDGETAFNLTLSDNGDISATGRFVGDLDYQGATVRALSMGFDGNGASWRDAAKGARDKLTGAARINVKAPNINIEQAEIFAPLSTPAMQALLGGSVTGGAIGGAFDVTFDQDGIKILFADDEPPLTVETDKGTKLVVSPQGNAPFLSHEEARDAASFQFAISGSGINANGAADAEYIDGNWRLAAPINIDAYQSPALSLNGSRIDIAARSEGENILADINLKSGLKKLTIGRLTIDDTPFTGGFEIAASTSAKRATIANKSECLALARTHALLSEQDMEARLSGLELCNREGRLMSVNWSEQVTSTLNGILSAQDANFRIGQTKASGKPPVIAFDADYHLVEDVTRITGIITDGDMTLNDVLDMSAVDGGFEFVLDAEEMKIDAIVDNLHIAQHGEAPLIAPVIATATARIVDNDATFDYVLSTPSGDQLGAGRGTQNMQQASGETVFSFEGLKFAPAEVQPNELSPLLKGFVDAAVGEMGGEMVFGWSESGITSSAGFSFKDISFGGPTRAVTRTTGFNGNLALTNLMPVTTDGTQTITVDVVDMDALKLTDGIISFNVPGDDTIVIPKADFPWFGGVIGVYDAVASLTGEAQIPLRADRVELAQIFEYVEINGLSGEGTMNGVLPVVFEDGKARIENGILKSAGPGAIRYQGEAAEQAASAGGNAKIAFDILRDLRYSSLEVRVNGALDGRLDFQMFFEGTGEVNMDNAKGRVPVKYTISLDAALLELLQQANLSRSFQLQIEQGLQRIE